MGLDNQRDAEAFVRIVRDHQKAVFSVAYAKLGNVHDAEDVKQDVFVEAWRNIRKLRSAERVQRWLFATTANRCKDYFRKKSRREKREAVYVESVVNKFEPLPNNAEKYDAVLAAISALPEKIRIVVMLRHLAHLSYEEISKMTGLPKSTIDGRLRIGKRKLRERLLRLNMGIDI